MVCAICFQNGDSYILGLPGGVGGGAGGNVSCAQLRACINSRPLTFVGDEIDAGGPLTPSHFLIGRTIGFHPIVSLDSVAVPCVTFLVP